MYRVGVCAEYPVHSDIWHELVRALDAGVVDADYFLWLLCPVCGAASVVFRHSAIEKIRGRVLYIVCMKRAVDAWGNAVGCPLLHDACMFLVDF